MISLTHRARSALAQIVPITSLSMGSVRKLSMPILQRCTTLICIVAALVLLAWPVTAAAQGRRGLNAPAKQQPAAQGRRGPAAQGRRQPAAQGRRQPAAQGRRGLTRKPNGTQMLPGSWRKPNGPPTRKAGEDSTRKGKRISALKKKAAAKAAGLKAGEGSTRQGKRASALKAGGNSTRQGKRISALKKEAAAKAAGLKAGGNSTRKGKRISALKAGKNSTRKPNGPPTRRNQVR
jgi:hypothetical protein